MENYSTLTQRYLKKHKGRTALTLIGIIIAIAMFTAIGSIYYSGINSEIERVKESKGDFEVLFLDLNKEQLKVLKANAEIKNGGVVRKEGILHVESDKLTDSLKLLNIKSYDQAAFKDIFRVKLVDGRLPQNGSEILVDKKYYAVLKDKNLEKALKGKLEADGIQKEQEFRIVGTYESDEITNWAISYLNSENAANASNYDFYANIKQAKNKVDIAQKIAKANSVKLDVNTSLLYLIGEGPDKNRNEDINRIFGIIVGFVILCTVVVIYNAFNISVMERIKHFGILRSIGATKSQIRNLVFKEAAIMSLIAVPIGILCGLAGIFVTFRLFMDGFLGSFQIGFYPQVLIVAAVLGIVTVYISAFLPARTASKVSPIDAIRGTVVIKGDKVKRRHGLWARLIFKFEGEVAYKNIKRSRKRFYVTCLSLMISLVMFVFFSNFIDIVVESNKIASEGIKVEGILADEGRPGETLLNPAILQKVQALDGIRELFELNYRTIPYAIDKNKVNSKFTGSLKQKEILNEYKDQYIINNTQLVGYDRNALELLNKQNKTNIDYSSFADNNEVILVNKAAGMDENKRRFYDSFTKYKIGDTIALPVLDKTYFEIKDRNQQIEQMQKVIDSGNTMTFKVVGVIDYETITYSIPNDSYAMIMSSKSYGKLTGNEGLSIIAMNFESPDFRNKNFEKLNIIADEYKSSYMDVYNEKKEYENLQNQMMILVYGFISLIVLISTVNIINTVTINLLVKKREYATFKAIGMTRGQFMKLVLLEGALFGVIACIIGLPVAFALTYFGIVRNNPLGSIGYTYAAWPYIAGGAGIIAITLLAALFPLRKLNNMNIVEALRVEE